MNYALWIIQGLLALLFLFTGGTKLVLPMAEMTKDIKLPGLFLRFIGAAEILGAVGLILPELLRIGPGLTPLAAAGRIDLRICAPSMARSSSVACFAKFHRSWELTSDAENK